VIEAEYRHRAGGPGQSTEDAKWLDAEIKDFFAKN
jgi:hypothetical protein